MFGRDAKGLPNDTVAVLTSVVAGEDLNKLGWGVYDGFVHYVNLTLPHGFFSRSPVEPVTGGLPPQSLPPPPLSLAPVWLRPHPRLQMIYKW